MRRAAVFLAAMLALVATACDEDPGEAVAGVGEITEYEVVFRQPGTDGDAAFILVAPGAHSVEALDSFARRIIAEDSGLWGIEVFDSEEALEAGLAPLLSADDVALLSEHHLLSVIGRRVIRFQGPYADQGERSIED